MMLVLRDEQSHEHVDVKQADHGPSLLSCVVGEAIHIFDRKGWSAGATRKHGHAPVKANVSIRDSPKQRLNEFVDRLAGLIRESGEPLLQCGIESDRGARHTPSLCHEDGHRGRNAADSLCAEADRPRHRRVAIAPQRGLTVAGARSTRNGNYHRDYSDGPLGKRRRSNPFWQTLEALKVRA